MTKKRTLNNWVRVVAKTSNELNLYQKALFVYEITFFNVNFIKLKIEIKKNSYLSQFISDSTFR